MNILIIDDHQLFANTLRNLLLTKQGVKEVFLCTDGNYNYESYLSKTDLIICDLVIPDQNGLKIIEHIRKALKINTPIIILSAISDSPTIRQSMRLQANAFVSKNVTPEELLEAIDAVLAKKQYISKNLRDGLINTMFVEDQIIYHLSPREKEVLQEICHGSSIKEIAHKMKLSSNTVQSYHRNVMKKLKVSRIADLIVYAIKHGLYVPKIDERH